MASHEHESCCWGSHLIPSRECYHSSSGKGTQYHFKNKFCPACRELVYVSASRTRALTETLKASFAVINKTSSGFWKTAPAELGSGEFRLLNQTLECKGPWLVVFRAPPPDGISWGELPADWIIDNVLPMTVARGTLVPISEIAPTRWLQLVCSEATTADARGQPLLLPPTLRHPSDDAVDAHTGASVGNLVDEFFQILGVGNDSNGTSLTSMYTSLATRDHLTDMESGHSTRELWGSASMDGLPSSSRAVCETRAEELVVGQTLQRPCTGEHTCPPTVVQARRPRAHFARIATPLLCTPVVSTCRGHVPHLHAA